MENEEFAKIVKENSNRLYLIALSYTKSHYDAEDVVQDVFAGLLKKNISFNDNEHLHKWLTVACINKSKDYFRTSFFKRNAELDEANALYTFDTSDKFDVFNAVMKLPKKECLAIHLFYYEDLSVSEIAKILNTKEATIKTRMRRARIRLKEMLGDEWINE